MRVTYYGTGPSDSETCEWCGAEIHNVTLIVMDDGTEHRLGPECGHKAVKAWRAQETEAQQAKWQADNEKWQRAERARIEAEYHRRFG